MEFSSAITEAKKQLRAAKRNHRKNIASLEQQLTDAQTTEKKVEKSFQKAYDEKLLLARIADASLYHDRIEGEDWTIPLNENVSASLRTGRERMELRGKTFDEMIFITITSPKKQVTVKKKLELGLSEDERESDEINAQHFVDAVYNATKNLEELAHKQEQALVELEEESALLEDSKLAVEKAQETLDAAEADTSDIDAAQANLDYLVQCALAVGFDKRGKVPSKHPLAKALAIAIPVALILRFLGVIFLFF